jgi:hypothetical protein
VSGSARGAGSDGRLFRAGLCLCVAAYALHAWRLGFVSDDGYIVYRYVRNLLDGYGPVYNPGERVEGCTGFLWMIAVAAVDWIAPGSHIPRVGALLGYACGAAAVVGTGLLGRGLGRRLGGMPWYGALLAPALLAVDTSFCAWSTGGLETPLFTLLALLGAALYARAFLDGRSLAPAGLVLGLATLTRPDGVVLFGATTAFELARRVLGRRRILDRGLGAWLGAFAAVFVPWYVWRYGYYGWPLPNTFYAKVGSPGDQWRRGARYVLRYARTHAWFALPLAAVALAGRRDGRGRGPHPAVLYLATLVAAWIGYVVAVGGDGLVLHRFLVPVAPLTYVLVQEGGALLVQRAGSLLRGRARAWRAAAAGLAVLTALAALAGTAGESLKVLVFPEHARYVEPQSEIAFPGNGRDHDYLWFDAYFVERLARAGRWLEANAAPGALIASTPAGAIAFYTSHPVLDMLGLNDEHIAHADVPGIGAGRAGHEKGDGRYVLSRRPEYVLLGNVAVLPRPLTMEEMPAKLVRRSEHELWELPEFQRDYERVVVELEPAGLFRYFTFFRRRAAAEAR